MNEKLVNAAQVAQKEVAALQEKMDLAAKMYQAGREAEGAVLLQEAAVLTRNMSDRYRDLLMSSGNPDYAARLEQIMAEVHPVQIGFTEQGWFGIRMEPLALDRETASKEYIRSIIYPAMRNFFADKDTVRYDRCTVAYRHILDADLPVTGRPDYTNAEIKMVTDTVAMYVMVDDNPVRCRLSHTCIPGANAHTEVYVIPQEDFVEWVKLEDTIPDEGLPLTDQVPERWKVDMKPVGVLRCAGPQPNLEGKMIFIREGTRAHRLLMLLACVGEYPMQAVCLLGNDRVWKRRIRQLQKVQDFCLPDGAERVRLQMLTVSGKGKSKTIRLHKSALPMLRKTVPDAFRYYTEHFPDHHFSGAATHVSRNHRIAEVVAMCMAAKIGVLPWLVRDLQDPQVRYQNVDRASCYLSGALKEFYADEMAKTGFTRIAGAIVYPQGVYAVYNTRDQPMLWRGRGEEKAQILLSSIFRTGGFRTEADSAILVGRDFHTAAATLVDAFARRHLKERLDQIYRHLHFIPQNEFGVKLLQIITMEDWDAKLREAIFGDERANPLPRGLEHDAYMDEAYHFSHLDGDLCRLIRFRRSMRNWPEEQYVLVCYSEQMPYLKEYLGDLWDGANLRVQGIDMDALHTHLQKA